MRFGQPRTGLARINADGSLNSWNPVLSVTPPFMLTVHTIAIDGGTIYSGTIYIGGSFNTIGGQTRNYVAALNTGNNNATSWNPNANSLVLALAVGGGAIYVGGVFTTMNGQPCNRIAAFDETSGDFKPS